MNEDPEIIRSAVIVGVCILIGIVIILLAVCSGGVYK